MASGGDCQETPSATKPGAGQRKRKRPSPQPLDLQGETHHAKIIQKKEKQPWSPNRGRGRSIRISTSTGMPALDSIISVRPLETSEATAVADSLNVPGYRIIRTNEVDAYEKAATSIETLNAAIAAAAAAPVGDNFKGTSRKAPSCRSRCPYQDV